MLQKNVTKPSNGCSNYGANNANEQVNIARQRPRKVDVGGDVWFNKSLDFNTQDRRLFPINSQCFRVMF